MSESESAAQDRFDEMLENADEMSPDERFNRMEEQREHIKELTANLREINEQRRAKLKESIRKLENDDEDDTPVLED